MAGAGEADSPLLGLDSNPASSLLDADVDYQERPLAKDITHSTDWRMQVVSCDGDAGHIAGHQVWQALVGLRAAWRLLFSADRRRYGRTSER